MFTLKAKGLFTYANPLSSVPQGAMDIADNCVIDADDIISCRRGLPATPIAGGVATDYPNKVFSYQAGFIASMGAGALNMVSNGLYPANANLMTLLAGVGDATPPINSKTQAFEMGGNSYLTSAYGLRKIDNPAGLKYLAAGLPRATFNAIYSTAPGTGAFLANGFSCAYRFVWATKDGQGNYLFGPPSGRMLVINTTGAAATVSLYVNKPAEITSNWFLQVYRTTAITTADVEPLDDMQLVYELTSPNLALNFFGVVDTTPDALRGAALYTNSTQEGILQLNQRPPLALDVAKFSNCAFYANTQQLHSLTIADLVGPNLSNGWPDGQALYINGNSFVGRTVPGASNEFLCNYSGLTVSQGIAAIMRALVNLINSKNSSTWNAFYVSGDNEAPGKILIQTRNLGDPSFGVAISGNATSFKPQLPASIVVGATGLVRFSQTVTVTTATAHGFAVGQQIVFVSASPEANFPVGVKTVAGVGSATTFTYPEQGANATSTNGGLVYAFSQYATSDNESKQNRLYFSKYQQAEAVPPVNYLDIGTLSSPIMRIFPMRDALYIFKDEGLYRLTGTNPANFRVDVFDSTVRLVAVDSVAAVANQLYALTTQGVVSVSSTGVTIVSRAIEDLINNVLPLLGPGGRTNNLPMTAIPFAVGYNSDRKYVLFVPSTYALPDRAYVFNIATNAWTKWPISAACGSIQVASDKLLLADGITTGLMIENKNFSSSDFIEYSATLVPSAFTSTTFTITPTASLALRVGDTVSPDGGAIFVQITAINTTGGVVTVNAPFTFTSYVLIQRGVAMSARWIINAIQSPADTKHWQEVSLIALGSDFNSLAVTFATEISPATDTVTVAPPQGAQRIIRTFPTLEKSRSVFLSLGFSHSYPQKTVRIAGAQIKYEGTDGRGTS